MPKQLEDFIAPGTLIPVVVIDDVITAVPLAECLVECGLQVLEITMRTETALESARSIVRNVRNCVVGIGSIFNDSQRSAAEATGAHFGVSPGTPNDLLASLTKQSWPFLPGAATLTEIMTLRGHGFRHQKVFPAETLGGIDFLKAVSGPVSDVMFCPTGGVRQSTLHDYMSQNNVFAVGGSWIAPRELIASQDWVEISSRASLARAIIERHQEK